MRRAVAAVSLGLGLSLAASGAAVAQTPRPPHERPPAAGSGDEAGMWYAADMAEAKAKVSGDRDLDPALNAYVKGVECKVAPEYCDEIRVYVMDRPVFNASTAPNGYIEVWSGVLLRARNEAALAFILGHETTHYAYNHSLKSYRALKTTLNVILPIGIAAAPFAGGLVLDIGYLGALAGYEHYSRADEMAADRGGFERMVKAGYDGSAAPQVWRDLIDEQALSKSQKVREEAGRAELFDSHPLAGERLDAMQALAKTAPKGDLGQARFRAAIRPHLAAFLRSDLQRGDYGETLFVIKELQSDGGDVGVLAYYEGETLRLRDEDGDAAKALAAYRAATAAPDCPAAAWRQLGDLYRRQHDDADALAAYQGYLDHAAGADDRWLVEGAMKKLGQKEGT